VQPGDGPLAQSQGRLRADEITVTNAEVALVPGGQPLVDVALVGTADSSTALAPRGNWASSACRQLAGSVPRMVGIRSEEGDAG
jgi:hypothetical protein